LRQRLPEAAGQPLSAVLGGAARHFNTRSPDRATAADEELLRLVDDGVDAVGREGGSEARRGALVALTSLRRNLFPDARPYRAAA
jgi:hypothetical protein